MRRPNIVFILADDMGFWTLGSAGNRDAVTPNLDEMAPRRLYSGKFFLLLSGVFAGQGNLVDRQDALYAWYSGLDLTREYKK